MSVVEMLDLRLMAAVARTKELHSKQAYTVWSTPNAKKHALGAEENSN